MPRPGGARRRVRFERSHQPVRGVADARVQPAPAPPRPQPARGAEASVGRTLYAAALAGGARALGRDCGALRAGALADMVAIDRGGEALGALTDEQMLDGLVFAADDRVVRDVWSAGRHVVREGRHVARERVAGRYRRTLADVMARI